MQIVLVSACNHEFKISPLDLEQYRQVFPERQGDSERASFSHWKCRNEYYELSEFSVEWLAGSRLEIRITEEESQLSNHHNG